MNGWIKLHRKIWDSPDFDCRNRQNVILVWIWLLTHAKDGEVTFGRHQIAKSTGINTSSVHRAITKLIENMPEVKYEANKYRSKITICNWEKYQSKPNNEVKDKRKTSEKQVNTNKKKEIRIKNNTNVLGIYGNPDINRIMETFENSFGMKPVRIKANRNAAQRILLKVKDVDKVCRIVEYAASIQGDRYSPSIGSLIDIEEKLIKLVAHSKSATERMYDAG